MLNIPKPQTTTAGSINVSVLPPP
ncbi:hypothetical protein V500_02454, partial [Pseudogymnoascus sp. VKM F-4518 (FW-2643)]